MHTLRTTSALIFTLFLTTPILIHAVHKNKRQKIKVSSTRGVMKRSVKVAPIPKKTKQAQQKNARKNLSHCGCCTLALCGAVVAIEGTKAFVSWLQNG